MATEYDLAVVGGGAVGAAFAALAVRQARVPAARVVVIERERPAPWRPTDDYDLRVFALSRASARILAAAGAWEAIEAARVSPYERMRVWHASMAPRGGEALVFDAAELGEPNLGYIVEGRLIQAALHASLETLGVTIVPANVEALALSPMRPSSGSASVASLRDSWWGPMAGVRACASWPACRRKPVTTASRRSSRTW